ncbi:anaerobic ribonucleoside-triphosphate reductase activating protein [Candidatus Woesearchaeota archaeon]|nr:anaerobic ribonucleoside-triphosphate reductase activating protein [Candidatus Woesearchaeota archaeon]
MIIKGFQETTMIDYPGHIAAIVFVPRCNFRCPFCYNKSLVNNSDELKEINEEEILNFLKKRKKLIDGIVITGGEPTLYADLTDFASKVKEIGLLVKIDTNGTNPDLIKKLLEKKLVDYIAMDIKNCPEKYEKTAGMGVDVEKIKKTVQIIMDSGIDYEFRTTCLPLIIGKEDFVKIGEWLKGAKKYCIQQFKPLGELIDASLMNETSYSHDALIELKTLLEPYFKKVEVRV